MRDGAVSGAEGEGPNLSSFNLKNKEKEVRSAQSQVEEFSQVLVLV